MLVDSENAEQIEQAVLKLLKDERLRESLGTNGRMHIEKDFGITKNIDAMRELYLSLWKK